MNPSTFITEWVASELVPVADKFLDQLGIDEASKSFVSQVGLPPRPLMDMKLLAPFDEVRLIETVSDDACNEYNEYVILGKWIDAYIVEFDPQSYVSISKEQPGEVINVDLYYCNTSFFNSSLQQMLECCLVHEKYRRSLLTPQSYQEIDVIWAKLRADLYEYYLDLSPDPEAKPEASPPHKFRSQECSKIHRNGHRRNQQNRSQGRVQ